MCFMGKILRYSCIPQWVRKLELLVSIVDIYLQIFSDLVIGKASGSDRVIFSGRNLLQLCLGLPKGGKKIKISYAHKERMFLFLKYHLFQVPVGEVGSSFFLLAISSPFMLFKKVTAS